MSPTGFKAGRGGAPKRSAAADARDLDDVAMGWVIRLTSGLAEDDELEAFRAWRDESPDHAAAVAEARDLWTRMGPALVAGQERRLAEAFVGSLPRAAAPGQARRTARPAWGRQAAARPAGPRRSFPASRWAGMAAALAVAVMATSWMSQSPFADLSANAATRSAALADGSRVMLAPGTALDVDIGASGERRINLEKGEAMFDVAHDPSRPFVVRSGEGEIRVLGTAFTVKKTGGMTQVIVARGRVEVKSGSETRILKPDRMVVYGLTTMGGIRAVAASDAQSWTKGRLVFENETLGDVIAELDRFEPRKVMLLNRDVRLKRVNAIIDLERSDYWLSALEQSEGVSVTRLPGMIIIR